MDLHLILIFVAGIATSLVFLLPHILKNRILSPAMIFVLMGYLLFSLPIDLPFIDPERDLFDRKILEYLTEFIVILSLAAIGLKIDRKPSFKNWSIGIWLIGLAMPLTIIFIAVTGFHFLGLSIGASILLGASLAPTDPVLAGNVQVDPPNEGDGHPVKFALTLEAGINDALAFPFIFLALVVEEYGDKPSELLDWFGYHFLLKIAVAIIVGYIIGRLIAKYYFKFVESIDSEKKTQISQGTFLIAATLLTYGFTELLHGYGFLAVFIAAVTGRQVDIDNPSHNKTYDAISQVEELLIGIFLIVFGGVMATGGLIGVGWKHLAISLFILFIIRPVAGMISMAFFKAPFRQKMLVSFFGIRGIGTLYYLAFVSNEMLDFGMIDEVWKVANVTIILSIIIHGVADSLIMSKVSKSISD